MCGLLSRISCRRFSWIAEALANLPVHDLILDASHLGQGDAVLVFDILWFDGAT